MSTNKARTMSPVYLIVALFLAVAAFGWWMYHWQFSEADRILEKWASENNLQLVEKIEANPSGTGPYDRHASNKQVMYRIKVRDESGRIREGIARIGSERLGTLSDQIEIQWDP